MTIQSIAEKYLENACIDNVCTDGGNIVIMNPKTGDVLAMATYPDYNLMNHLNQQFKKIQITGEIQMKQKKIKDWQAVWRK